MFINRMKIIYFRMIIRFHFLQKGLICPGLSVLGKGTMWVKLYATNKCLFFIPILNTKGKMKQNIFGKNDEGHI